MGIQIKLSVDQDTKDSLLQTVLTNLTDSFPDTLLVCRDGQIKVNRLAVCLLLPWLGSSVSLAAGLATVLLPMHYLAELGYRKETGRDTTKDTSEDAYLDQAMDEQVVEKVVLEETLIKEEERNNDYEISDSEDTVSEVQGKPEPDESVQNLLRNMIRQAGEQAGQKRTEKVVNKPGFEGAKIKETRGTNESKKRTAMERRIRISEMGVQLKQPKYSKQKFLTGFQSLKFIMGTLQKKNGLEPNFALFVLGNAHKSNIGPNASPFAGKILSYAQGDLRENLFIDGIHYDPDNFFLMANDVDLKEDELLRHKLNLQKTDHDSKYIKYSKHTKTENKEKFLDSSKLNGISKIRKYRAIRANKLSSSEHMVTKSRDAVKQSFLNGFQTAKFIIGTLQKKNGFEPNFALFLQNNCFSPNVVNCSPLAGKVLTYVSGSLKEDFLNSGIKYESDSFYMMANDDNLDQEKLF